jgi:hypothetical protein
MSMATSVRTMQETREGFWDVFEPGVGAQRFCRDKDGCAGDFLVIFVHGLVGDSQGTWGALPSYLEARLGLPCHFHSVAIPSGLCHSTDIAFAASILANHLEKYVGTRAGRNIVVCTHSVGALVVKAMLAAEAIDPSAELGRDDSKIPEYKSLWPRIRLIVNFDAPFDGGDWLLTALAIPLYYSLSPLIGAAAAVLNRFGRAPGGFHAGTNRMIGELRYHNPAIPKLDEAYRAREALWQRAGCPTPVIRNAGAMIRGAIAERRRNAGILKSLPSLASSYFPGGHGRVKLPRAVTDQVVTGLVRWCEPFTGSNDVGGTADTVRRELIAAERSACLSLRTRRFFVRELAGRTEGPPKAGSEASVLESLRALVGGGHSTVVLRGAPGVGKSTVMRWLGRSLAVEALSGLDKTSSTPLPLFFPLGDFRIRGTLQTRLGSDGVAPALWGELAAQLCEWGNSTCGFRAFTIDWLECCLSRRPIVMLFDGADELFNHSQPFMQLVDFRRLALHLHSRFAENPSLTCIFALRSHLPAQLLGGQSAFELREWDIVELATLFPKMALLLDDVRADIRRVVRSPLLARAFNDLEAHTGVPAFESEAAIWEFLLCNVWLRAAALDGCRLAADEPQTCANMLAAIGWVFFETYNGALSADEVVDHLSRYGGLFDEVPSVAVDARAMVQAIMSTSLFIPVEKVASRLMHAALGDFLAARFIASRLRIGDYKVLRRHALTTRIFRLVGEMLVGATVTKTTIDDVVQVGTAVRDPFVTGNFGALLGSWHCRIEGPALSALLSLLADPATNRTARHVVMGGWAFRALLDRPGDASARFIRHAMQEYFVRFVDGDLREMVGPVTRSMLWCYLKAFHITFGMEPPSCAWPALTGSNEEQADALELLFLKPGGREDLNEEQRSLQVAWLEIQREGYGVSDHRTVSAIHYLHGLVAAYRDAQFIADVPEELPGLLADGGIIAQIVDRYPVAEVREVRNVCRKLLGS